MTILALTTGQYFTFPILAAGAVAILVIGWATSPNRKANKRRKLIKQNRRDGIGGHRGR